jgi:hypothetical protein
VSLKKKLLLSFLVGAAIMAALSAFLYANFVEIRAETAFLELTDTVRSKSLQPRRHEKNYLFYAPAAGDGPRRSAPTPGARLSSPISLNPDAVSLPRLAPGREYRRVGRIEMLVGAIAANRRHSGKRSGLCARERAREANVLDKPLADVAYPLADPTWRRTTGSSSACRSSTP